MDPEELQRLQAKNASEPEFKGNWADYDFRLRRYCVKILTNLFPLERVAATRAPLRCLVPQDRSDGEQLAVHSALVTAFVNEGAAISKIIMSVPHTTAECGTVLYDCLFKWYNPGGTIMENLREQEHDSLCKNFTGEFEDYFTAILNKRAELDSIGAGVQ
jgi:hypothetical protein